MKKIKDAFLRFMYGRYGGDSLGKALFWLYILIILADLFIPTAIPSFFALAVAFWMIFRMFSKNIYKRSAENRKYLDAVAKIKQKAELEKSKWRDRKTHIYKKCPHCKAVLRLPRKKAITR